FKISRRGIEMLDSFKKHLQWRGGKKRVEGPKTRKPRKGETLLRVEGIIKRFPGVWRQLILDHVDFDVKAGEIHGLLGENGAGKTVLANIMSGFYSLTEGQIYVRGKHVSIKSPSDALELGIEMVHQELSLADRFTVAENIALALPAPSYSLPISKVEKRAEKLSKEYGLKVDPKAEVGELSAGEQQRVEILKALCYEPEVLLLDEPASMLTPRESEDLFSTLRDIARKNKGIMFITHKLEEALKVSDRISVLRLGKLIGTKKASETSRRELVRMMMSRKVPSRPKRKAVKKGKATLEVKNLHVISDRGLPAVKGVSLSLKEGEILGIAGVAGNGQSELVEAITGLRMVEKGKVRIFGKDMTNSSPQEIIEKGVAYIPEDRRRVGISEGMTVAENIVLKDCRKSPFCKRMFLDYSTITSHAEELVSKHEALVPDLWKTESRILSGGNIQRLILARELWGEPSLIIAVHPTYGLDPRGLRYTHKLFLKMRDRGASILLASENLDEIMSISDRIAVMFEGKIAGAMDAAKAKKEEIGMMMLGAEKDEA
ncbi:MAG: ABC transporter ATP-binding protein, partial [Candidatus Hadarchaeota archaeon]|nr:ABC transporter ATP-binding protein [Candidatus Hadarchaeota archaeon]